MKASVVLARGTPLTLEGCWKGDEYVCGPNHDCVLKAETAMRQPGTPATR